MIQLLGGLFARVSSETQRAIRLDRPRARLAVEQLEDRLALSWTGVPPSVISVAGAARVSLNSFGNANGSAYVSSNEVDLYALDTTHTGVYRFSATTPFSDLDTVLGVFNSAGQRLAFNDDIASTNLDSQVSITLAAGRRYYFGVTNYTGTPGGSYSWYVDGPQPITDDAHEDNDTLATAIDLGTPNSLVTVRNLMMSDANDYFRFRLAGPGNAASFAAIDFAHAQGNLNLVLYNAQGSVLRYSAGFVDDERISLNGLSAGTYVLRVYGYSGAHNPSYSLLIDPAVTQGVGNRVLYLNFDGANISRTALVRWAGTDWSASVNELDADRNGITVQPFLRNRTDRETIINRILTLVREDLSPFGITVQRTTGLAVEGVGATTIFLGVSTLSNDYYHVAADVDFGNNNRTDIAFVGDENWGAVETTALAMADVTLHEAGHGWGLYHVYSGTNPESMGLRYSVSNQALWATNTRYMNQSFAEYVDSYGPHGGGRGPQNSYQTMSALFGTSGGSSFGGPAGNVARSSIAAAGPAMDMEISLDGVLGRIQGHSSGCCCPGCGRRLDIDKYLFMGSRAAAEHGRPPSIALGDLPTIGVEQAGIPALPRRSAVDVVWTRIGARAPVSPLPVQQDRLVDLAALRPWNVPQEASPKPIVDLVFADLNWLQL